MKRLIVLLLITVVVLTSIHTQGKSQAGHMTLLAVSETNGELQGSTANLFLTLRPGTGKVFIDTQPASKLDTQMSTRLAKNIACKFVEKDCSKYDFFYTIKSGSVIIGGPSASGSVALLTAAVLEKKPVRQDAAFTGTIGSGNLIGTVAGIQKKVDAAAEANMSLALIPKGTRFVQGEPINLLTITSDVKNEINNASTTNQPNINQSNVEESNIEKTNVSSPVTAQDVFVDAVTYGRQKGVEVYEITTLQEAYELLTDSKMQKREKDLEINKEYTDTMKMLGAVLCERSLALQKSLNSALLEANTLDENENTSTIKKIKSIKREKIINVSKNDIIESQNQAYNLTAQGETAFNRGDYYSAASFCFGANVQYKDILYQTKGFSDREIKQIFATVAKDIIKLNNRVNSYNIKTITDLQAYMIVKERLIEAEDRLLELKEEIERINNKSPDLDREAILSQLSFVVERTYSAVAWTSFFGKEGKTFKLEKYDLRESCNRKLSETLEFYQYVNFLFPNMNDETKRQIEKATGFQRSGNYAMCLFKAALAKAQINLVLSTLTIQDASLDAVLQQKMQSAEESITEQQRSNIFPVLGYSYLEYARSLQDQNKFSALLYSEYALELSNIDIYLTTPSLGVRIVRTDLLLVLVAGIMIGLLSAEVYNVTKRLINEEKDKANKKTKKTKRKNLQNK
jgi:uncharacterized protein